MTDDLIITNSFFYFKIANDAFISMEKGLKESIRPKPNGEEGNILTFDPDRKTFGNSLVSVVFFGMYLDSLLHIMVSRKIGVEEYRKHIDRKTYEEKLKLLGINEQVLLDRVKEFREGRNELVHEKALLPSDSKTGQDEARKCYELMQELNILLGVSP
jgi:hypothetical protein